MAVKSFSAYPFEKIFFFLALAVPLLIIPGRAVAEIAMGLVSVYFLYHSWRTKDWAWTRETWVRFAAIVWVYLMISAAIADFDSEGAIKRAVGWFRFPLFTIAFSTLFLPQEKTRRFVRIGIAVLLACVSVDTIVQFATGTSLTGHPLPRLTGRSSGPFGPDMIVGTYIARISWPVIGLLFAWGMTQSSFAKRFALPVAFTALMGVAILISGERVALGVFALSGLTFWALSKKLRLPLLAVAVIGAVGLGSLLWFHPTLHARFIDRTSEVFAKGSDSSYGRVWHNAKVTWNLSPVFGVGPRNYVAACETLREPGGYIKEAIYKEEFNCARHPHNPYVEWLVETGTIGLLLFIGLVGLWFRNGWRHLRAADDADYYARLGFLVALIAFLWPIMSSMSFFSNWSAILFWWTLSFSQMKSVSHARA